MLQSHRGISSLNPIHSVPQPSSPSLCNRLTLLIKKVISTIQDFFESCFGRCFTPNEGRAIPISRTAIPPGGHPREAAIVPILRPTPPASANITPPLGSSLVTIPNVDLLYRITGNYLTEARAASPASSALTQQGTTMPEAIRYHDLSQIDRTSAHAQLYQALYPLVVNVEPREIPTMVSYDGRKISCFREGSLLGFVESSSWTSRTIFFDSEGNTLYRETTGFPPNGFYLEIINADIDSCRIVGENQRIFQQNGIDYHLQYKIETLQNSNERYIFQQKIDPITRREISDWESFHPLQRRELDTISSSIEHYLFKLDLIHDCFTAPHSQGFASEIFTQCYTFLHSLSRTMEAVNQGEDQSWQMAPPAVDGTTTYHRGPIWSPVASSQDSLYRQTVTHNNDGTITLELIKEFGGRMWHSTGQRRILMTLMEGGEIKVDIIKRNSSEDGNDETTSSYLVYQTASEGLVATPLGRETQSYQFPIFSDRAFTEHSSEIQEEDQMQNDLAFIMSSFATLQDIERSPHSYRINEAHQSYLELSPDVPFAYRLQDNHPVSNARFAHQALNYRQGSCHGYFNAISQHQLRLRLT